MKIAGTTTRSNLRETSSVDDRRVCLSTAQQQGKRETTFVHLFPATPVSLAYEAMAVRYGGRVLRVSIYEGRECFVTSSIRVRGRKPFGAHSRMSVHFLDGTVESIPAAKFNKAAQAAPIAWFRT